jgi:membrane-bound inhibitor of C-type lysozyme
VKRKHLIPVGTPVLHVHVPVQVRYTCGTCMYTCTPCILTVEYLPKGKITLVYSTYDSYIHTYFT